MFSSHVDSLSVADACMLTLTPYEHLQRLIQRFMLRGAIHPRSPPTSVSCEYGAIARVLVTATQQSRVL